MMNGEFRTAEAPRPFPWVAWEVFAIHHSAFCGLTIYRFGLLPPGSHPSVN